MRIQAEHSLLLSIDVQEKLLPAISNRDEVLDNNVWLLDIAAILDIPTLATRQYPKGLGGLVPPLEERIPLERQSDKIHFSAVSAGELQKSPDFSRNQIVLMGIEAHVCVLQTAFELREMGKSVFVVADAVGSRSPLDRELALTRMREAGCVIVSREMVLFEWLTKAGTEAFKRISKEFLR